MAFLLIAVVFVLVLLYLAVPAQFDTVIIRQREIRDKSIPTDKGKQQNRTDNDENHLVAADNEHCGEAVKRVNCVGYTCKEDRETVPWNQR